MPDETPLAPLNAPSAPARKWPSPEKQIVLVAATGCGCVVLLFAGLIAGVFVIGQFTEPPDYPLPSVEELNELLGVDEDSGWEAIEAYLRPRVREGMSEAEVDELLLPIRHEIRITFDEESVRKLQYIIADRSEIYVDAYFKDDTLVYARFRALNDIDYALAGERSDWH